MEEEKIKRSEDITKIVNLISYLFVLGWSFFVFVLSNGFVIREGEWIVFLVGSFVMYFIPYFF